MGENKRTKKKERAAKLKELKKNTAFAILRNNPTSPRRMRLVAELVRNKDVNQALDILAFAPQEPAIKLRKLLLSAIANWGQKNEGVSLESANLYIKEIKVDGARTLKRLRPAPQGRGYRILKRSNHVTIVVENKENN